MKFRGWTTVSLLLLVAGCGRAPDEVRTISTPLKGVTLTFETWNNGPLVSDTNSLIAHYEKNGGKATQLILAGDYLVLSKFLWPSPGKLVLCYKSGSAYGFTNQVDLQIGSDTKSFHVTLKEDC